MSEGTVVALPSWGPFGGSESSVFPSGYVLPHNTLEEKLGAYQGLGLPGEHLLAHYSSQVALAGTCRLSWGTFPQRDCIIFASIHAAYVAFQL